MEATAHASTARTLNPVYWLHDHAVYRDRSGGLILAHVGTGRSLFFQPGDDAAALENALNAEFDDPRHAGDEEGAIISADALLYPYGDAMVSPAEAGGRPSSDGGFWYWLA
jgi:hypothetical protein